jgi:hypothetical protein
MAAARAAAARAAKPADSLVSAVAANKSSTVPLQVKFDLLDRPDVGKPVDVKLVIVPMSGSVDRISGKVQADEGLELVEGAQIPATERPAEGVPIEHAIKVRPQRDGIFTFSAVVTVDSGGVSSSETYSMPVIAGAGLPDLPANGPAPPRMPPHTAPSTASAQAAASTITTAAAAASAEASGLAAPTNAPATR